MTAPRPVTTARRAGSTEGTVSLGSGRGTGGLYRLSRVRPANVPRRNGMPRVVRGSRPYACATYLPKEQPCRNPTARPAGTSQRRRRPTRGGWVSVAPARNRSRRVGLGRVVENRLATGSPDADDPKTPDPRVEGTKPADEGAVDEGSADSFPGADPPSFTSGPPARDTAAPTTGPPSEGSASASIGDR